MYIRWSSYAYGRDVFGQETKEGFQRVLARMEVTVKNEDSREKDNDELHGFLPSHHGGSDCCCAVGSKERPLFTLRVTAQTPEHVLMRTHPGRSTAYLSLQAAQQQMAWRGCNGHGFKGAGDISKAMDIILGWDATANVVDDWMYRRFCPQSSS